MKEEPAQGVQLLLTVRALTIEGMSHEMHRHLVAAVADLLLSVALRADPGKGGRADEREDP